MTIAAFPHHYAVELDGDGRLACEPRPAIAGGTPPQFGGTDTRWSPEELLVSAVSLCLLTTFQAYARRENLSVASYRCHADGTLVKTAAGPAFSSIVLAVELAVAAPDRERAARLLETAKNHCIITKALNVPVELQARIV